jgi:hypothetical protein
MLCSIQVSKWRISMTSIQLDMRNAPKAIETLAATVVSNIKM